MPNTEAPGLWHPHTQMKTAPTPLHIVEGKGAYLFSKEGRSYFDATSSWWVNLHGHAHPKIASAISLQAHTLEHCLFPGITHDPALNLMNSLLPLLPGSPSRLFFSDNGSTAVETALKIALQYWHNKGIPRRKIIQFNHGYHGETFGAMSVSSRSPYTAPFEHHLFSCLSIDPPLPGKEKQSLAQLKELLSKHKPAAFLFEPLLLGANGPMRTYTPEGLNPLLTLCKEEHVLMIADEVATGFGRAGPLFASSLLSPPPDLICLAKGLTGGFLPLAATCCTEEIYSAFLSDDREKALLHGHSYTANPLGCAAANASLSLLTHPDCTQRREAITSHWKTVSKALQDHPHLVRSETLGTLLAIECKAPPDPSYFLQRGIFLRPLGTTLYYFPPYCTTDAELTYLSQTLTDYLQTK